MLSDNEVSITTHQFNDQGRNGSRSASVHLASPYTVAASALAGEIANGDTMQAAAFSDRMVEIWQCGGLNAALEKEFAGVPA